MGIHAEWGHADHARLSIVRPRTRIGEGRTDDHAIVIDLDGCSTSVIEGTPEQLAAIGAAITAAAEKAAAEPAKSAPTSYREALASDLEAGDTYAPGGYDLTDPSAWQDATDVDDSDDEIAVYHHEDDEEDDAARFDPSAVVYIANDDDLGGPTEMEWASGADLAYDSPTVARDKDAR